MSNGKRVLLIISGGISAYKSLELIRELRVRDIKVRCILTTAGSQFVTPLSVEALTGNKVYQDLFSLTDTNGMGHIELSREADLIVIAPATANIIAKMRAGIADDLATTALIATDKSVLIAPSMNVRMWEHASTQSNMIKLRQRGVHVIGPEIGDMACGEHGMGRMSEPLSIAQKINEVLLKNMNVLLNPINTEIKSMKLVGRKAVVTSGPTKEAIDPVRYITNCSSGRQGHAIAKALSEEGAETILISGPTQLPDPDGVTVKHVNSALEMLSACKESMPADVVICAAAVADWRIANPSINKIKKNKRIPVLKLVENPDILLQISQLTKNRPHLVIGFAAETQDLIKNAQAKLSKKGCDWIMANDVSIESGTFDGEKNTIHMISKDETEAWPTLTKEVVGQKLSARIALFLDGLS
jgi:phosphopantothenoylcysteine decarboxylase/phosphopantothenate--cysteine ligase